jgi:predicted O-methyltransferase YrrM
MDFLRKGIEDYAIAHSSPETEVLRELNRETNAKILYPRMLSGHLQGKMLEMISHMIRPKKVLEIGTYTGYSAICLASGMVDGGTVDTIDVNEELEDFARRYIDKSGFGDRVVQHIGDAAEVILDLDGHYDLVFIDADKESYKKYLDLIWDKLVPGGFVLADNVLWSGKVLEGDDTDKDTQALIEFNDYVQSRVDMENMLLPLRDGLMLIRKL